MTVTKKVTKNEVPVKRKTAVQLLEHQMKQFMKQEPRKLYSLNKETTKSNDEEINSKLELKEPTGLIDFFIYFIAAVDHPKALCI